jgi:pyruvate dehydrogenase E1 component beta subunit
MMSALNDDNPVIYLEHKKLYASHGQMDPSAGAVPIGVANVVRPGSTITMAASLAMVQVAEQAALQLADEDIDVEVIDVRSLVPLDVSTIAESVRKTSRLVTVEEQPTFGGWGSQLVAEVLEVAFDSLDAPPVRVGAPWAPTAYSPVLEDLGIPSPSRVVAAVHRLLG